MNHHRLLVGLLATAACIPIFVPAGVASAAPASVEAVASAPVFQDAPTFSKVVHPGVRADLHVSSDKAFAALRMSADGEAAASWLARAEWSLTALSGIAFFRDETGAAYADYGWSFPVGLLSESPVQKVYRIEFPENLASSNFSSFSVSIVEPPSPDPSPEPAGPSASSLPKTGDELLFLPIAALTLSGAAACGSARKRVLLKGE